MTNKGPFTNEVNQNLPKSLSDKGSCPLIIIYTYINNYIKKNPQKKSVKYLHLI